MMVLLLFGGLMSLQRYVEGMSLMLWLDVMTDSVLVDR